MINSNIGYIICESTSEPLGTVVTPKELNGKVIAECILQTADERNRNGRYYAEEELFPQITAPRTVELLENCNIENEKDLNILFSEEKEKNTNENSNSKN